ncbi:hypothetical protein F4820DRAFT_444817 [Hypoxylon rubiginosum]|uniref:Uncharacterized protein n=1 Tax=Hypoxylon rubiginosum TaxID=110542 RepID=A0ACB9Z9Y1_9PEZI|nr:hypothetical protein F4820DRAFT_444817 [Hypoxylon rubiginosum]
MRASVIFLSGLAAVAFAAPVEVSTGLAERQYRPTLKVGKALEGEPADVEKRQYRPTYKEIDEGNETGLEERQYRPTYKEIAEADETE